MGDQMLPVGDFDNGGIVLDSDAFSLAASEWSGGRNVRFHNRVVSKILGEQTLLSLGAFNPRTLTHWQQPVSEFYVFTASDGTTRRINAAGVITNITKGAGSTPDPLSTASNAEYIASLFNGGFTYIVNDGVQVPQFLQANAATAELQDFTGWTYDSAIYRSVIPKVVRPFKNVLVAGNLTYTLESTGAITYAPGTIRVSNLAAPGALPTWDPNENGATTADEFELAETDGIVDMVPFQDQLLIFTRSSVFSLSLTGNTSVPVRTAKKIEGRGMLSANCGVELFGRVFVVGQEDIYIYAGGSDMQSVSDQRTRDYFFREYNGNTVFTVHNSLYDEVWVCFSRGSSTAANEALVWNYRHNTWSVRDINNAYAGTYGSQVFGATFLNTQALMLANNSNILQMDVGTSFSGNPINSYVERRGFDIAPNAVNFSKWTDSIYILATGTGDVTVNVRPTDTPGRPVDFTDASDRMLKTREFTLNGTMADFKIDPRVNGRYFNIRFGSNDATSSWQLIRYNLSFSADDDGRG